MGRIELHEQIEAPAQAAWEKLRDFGGIAGWMPGIEKCDVEGKGIGAVRSVGLAGGVGLKERLESLDEGVRTLSYSILEGPLPVQNYLATIRVSENGEAACRVDWTASFDLPEGVAEAAIAPALEGAYGGALKALKGQLEG
jgi:carbon monoxide dehydrogenase subunit G